MITDSDITEVVDAFITIANEGHALDHLLAQYHSNRTLAVRVVDTSFKYGFMFRDAKLQRLSDLDTPTVTVTMNKNTFWHIINSDSAKIARMRTYHAIFAEETILVEPPPGIESGALHLENVMQVFGAISEMVMGG